MKKIFCMVVMLLICSVSYASDYTYGDPASLNDGSTSSAGDVETEFNNIATAVATKLDETGGTMTGSLIFTGVATDITTTGNQDITATPHGTGRIVLNGSQVIKRTATAISYATLLSDYLIGVTSTAAPRTITLESDAALIAGFVYIIKDESGACATNNITIATEGAELIDGAATYVMNTNYEAVCIYADGVNFYVF